MNEEESAERELQARSIYIAARLWRRVLSGHRRPTRCLTARIGTCIEPRRKKRAKTRPDDAAFLRSTPRRTQKQDPEGPCFRRVPIASFNHRDGRNRDDGGDGDNGDGGAGIAAALPRSETYSHGGDDGGGGGDIVPVGRFHLLTARRLIHESLAVAN
jgi:hypothetical protein